MTAFMIEDQHYSTYHDLVLSTDYVVPTVIKTETLSGVPIHFPGHNVIGLGMRRSKLTLHQDAHGGKPFASHQSLYWMILTYGGAP